MSAFITNSLPENYNLNSTDSVISKDSKEIDNSFIEMLKDQFSNDGITDAYEQGIESFKNGRLSAAPIFGFDKETEAAIRELGNIITLDEISAALENDMANFRTMFDEALSQAGIARTPAFEIMSDACVRICIDSDRPDKDKIEKILNEVPNLAQTYKRIAATSSHIEEANTYIKFAKAYELDPQSALRQFMPVFEQIRNAVFSLFVDEESYIRKLTAENTGENLIDELSNC